MSATNLTKNLKLSQFVASDKPSWLGDVNGDNKKIDDGYGVLAGEISKANDTASSAKSQSDANTQTLTNVNTELEDHGNRITALEAGGGTEQLEQRVNTISSDVETLQTRADTFENEITTHGTTITTLTNSVNDLTTKTNTNTQNITSINSSVNGLTESVESLTTKVNNTPMNVIFSSVAGVGSSSDGTNKIVVSKTGGVYSGTFTNIGGKSSNLFYQQSGTNNCKLVTDSLGFTISLLPWFYTEGNPFNFVNNDFLGHKFPITYIGKDNNLHEAQCFIGYSQSDNKTYIAFQKISNDLVVPTDYTALFDPATGYKIMLSVSISY